ncbi:hypothetical protein R1flu_028505 [Riccia fluitans]|uniref:Uncharacterized protein n=1 Tax=Riccia fluitans TaxID=41844 RepID=A0ABD1XLV7_9MARC
MEELAFESCGVLDLVPLTSDEGEDGEQEELEELIFRIAEYVEGSIALEETILLEEDGEAFMEAQLRKQHLEECIEAITEYVEETIAAEEEEEEEETARNLQDCRTQDMEALVEAIAEYVEETLEQEEEELKDVVEEYVVDLKKTLFEDESKQEQLTPSVRTGVRFLETWYLNKPPRVASATRIKTITAGNAFLKGSGSRKRDFEGNVRSVCTR